MYQDFSTFLQDKTRISVIQAENPDGDSLGSAIALDYLLADRASTLYCPVDIPKYLRYFPDWSRVTNEFDFRADGYIIVDTASTILLSKLLDDPAIKNGGEILDLLADCGVPASKVILGHSGDTTDLEYLTAMLERGCWLGMDRFGFCDKDLALEPRVDTIAALCQAGWGHRLLLSHDWAAYLAFWDSWEATKSSDWMHLEEDYSFIHRRVLPALEERGLERAAVQSLLTDNPRNFFEGK